MKLRIGSKMLAGYPVMAGLILAGGLVTILYTYRLQHVTTRWLAENVSSFKAAQELEIVLFRMRGVAINYLHDENPLWLETLEVTQHDIKTRTAKENQSQQRVLTNSTNAVSPFAPE